MAYSVSEDFRTKCYSGESLYNCRLIIGNNTIPTSQISSITISSPIIDDQSQIFYIGSFISQKLTIQFKNLDGIDTTSGTNVELYISQYVNNAWVEVPIGKYVIDESPENYYQTAKIECLDYAVKFATNLDYSPCFVDGKTTIDTLLAWICTYYGVTLGSYPDTNGDVEIGTYDSTISGKRWISYIAEIKACNAKMDRLGQLTLIPLKSSPAVTIDALKSKSWELGEKFEISQVTFFDAIRNYTFGDDSENTLYLRQDNPFILNEQIARNVYEKLRLDAETVTQAETFNINNTIDGEPIQDLTLYGNTTQSSTPTPSIPVPINVVTGDQEIIVCGKNLADTTNTYNGYPTGSNGRTIGFSPSVNSITYKSCCYVIANQQYTLSWKINTPKAEGNRDIKIVNNNSIILQNFSYSNTNGNRTRTFIPNYDGWVYASLDANATEIQIEKGSSATAYEPYQSQTQLISLGVENLWKNQLTGFLPQSGAYPTTNSSYPSARYVLIPLITGQSITLSGSTSANGRVRYIDKSTNQVVGTIAQETNAYYTSTAHFTTRFNNGTITANKEFIVGIMDMSGSVNDLIVNYGKLPSYVSNNPIELCKIGTYQDKIYKDNGKWYLHKEIGKVVLDGSESSWAGGNASTGNTNYTYAYCFGLDNSIGTIRGGYCDKMVSISTPMLVNTYVNTDTICFGDTGTARIRLMVLTSRLSSANIAGVKALLSEKPMTCYYVLATPTNTEITDSELLEQLESVEQEATFKEGMTNITSTAPITFTKLTSNPFICYSLKTENYGDISL